MCTRFSCKLTLETVEAFFAALPDLSRPPPPPRADFALGQEVAVLPAGGRRTLTARRWGWPKPDGGLLANARSETLSQKPLFSRHADARRCVLPASGFYESRRVRGGSEPWFFSLKSTPVFGLAGLLNADGDVVILTTEPNARVRRAHRRMPVILRADLLSGWLNPDLPLLSLPEAFRAPWPDDDTDVQPPTPAGPQQPELF
jgi:putative SOS response-associated peptidase YedK